jgi:hypothetical protein
MLFVFGQPDQLFDAFAFAPVIRRRQARPQPGDVVAESPYFGPLFVAC